MNYWKLTFSLFCTLVYSQHIEINQSSDNPVSVEMINQGVSTQPTYGFHYLADSEVNWSYPGTSIDSQNINGVEIYSVTITQANGIEYLAPGDTFNLQSQWGETQSLSNFQVLTKHGTCSQPKSDLSSIQHQVSEINAVIAQSNYYDSTYKYLDTLGSKGGTYSGKWLDTFGEETQIQWAIGGTQSTEAWAGHLSDTNNSSDPMYWMALAAGQELLNFDAQYLMATGIKETGIGSSSNNSYMTNAEGAFGAYDSEAWTAVSRAGMYPELFAGFSQCEAELRTGNINTFESCMGTSSPVLMGQIFGIDSSRSSGPEMMNSVFFSGITLQSFYDLILSSSDFCGKSAMSIAADPYLGLCAISGHYNLGINGGVPSALKDSSLISVPDACDSVPAVNSNYVPAIRSIAEAITLDQNRWIQGDPDVYVIDKEITLDHIQLFLFGDSADYNSSSHNGLLWHFDLDTNQRLALWNDVEATFNLQKAHWSKESISLRYDWVTMLRLIKSHLNIVIQLNIDHGDSQRYIEQHSGGEICESTTILDADWPYVSLDTSTQYDSLIIYATIYDNTEQLPLLQYQFSDSSLWSDVDLTQDSTGVFSAQFTLRANGSDYAWIRTSDACHNRTTIKVEAPEAIPTSIAPTVQVESSTYTQALIYSIQGQYLGIANYHDNQWLYPNKLPNGHYILKPKRTSGFIHFNR